MMESLTHENFFKLIESRYPQAMEHFNAWLETYQKEVNWIAIFGTIRSFYNLPFEFQNGILARYELESFRFQGSVAYLRASGMYRDQLIRMFAERNMAIVIKSKKSSFINK